MWDVIVIGGGPAGMMAAGRAAELGRSVLLLEKNPILGKKLLITGGGRCNLTNNKQNIRVMAAQYKGSGQFLMSAFSHFDVTKTLNFFNSLGMATKEEAEGRMFPSSNTSQSVLDVLVKYMNKGKVEVRTNAMIDNLSLNDKKEYITLRLKKGKTLTTRSCIVATGGISHPETGSTGEGFIWLKKIGHTIVKKIAGVTLRDIKLTTTQNGKKQDAQKGKLLFTHFGISRPTILNMSKDIGELMYGG